MGKIILDPFHPEHVNPASIDLCLGAEVKVYRPWVASGLDPSGSIDGRDLYARSHESVYDVKNPSKTLAFNITPEFGWVLKPGILYLMHTVESVWSDEFVPVLDGKSSIGRLGIQVHVTAGYFDPGFEGQGTLEVVVTHPIKVYSGMRICQMRFHTMTGDFLSYQKTGQYKGNAAKGAVPSATYKQFKT